MLNAAPPRIETRIFSKLPDHLRMKGRVSGWSFGKGNDHLHSFIEGPAFDRLGNLYVTDIPYGRIFIADHRRGVMQLDPGSGAVTPVIENVRREGFKGTNDLTFARNGDLYFTDQGQTGLQDPTGRVYRLTADGHLDCLIDRVPSPNGLALSRDEKTLFVAVTRANQIWRLPLHADGTTSKVGAYINLSGGGGPDGMALDETGGLAIAHVGLGVVWLFDRLGEPVGRLQSCADLAVTNVAFGGPNGHTLFITESDSGSILMAEVPTAGHKLFSHQ